MGTCSLYLCSDSAQQTLSNILLSDLVDELGTIYNFKSMYLYINTSDIFEPIIISSTHYNVTSYFHQMPHKEDNTLNIALMLGLSGTFMIALCVYTISMQMRKDKDFQDLKRNIARVHAVDKHKTHKLNKILGLTAQQSKPTDDEMIDALQPVERHDSSIFDYARLATPSISSVTTLSPGNTARSEVFRKSPSILNMMQPALGPLPSQEEVALDLTTTPMEDGSDDTKGYQEWHTPSDEEQRREIYVPSKVNPDENEQNNDKKQSCSPYDAVPTKGSSEDESDAMPSVENSLLNHLQLNDLVEVMMSDEDDALVE